jgi:hypothetical protein
MEDVALCSLSHERRARLAAEIGRLSSYLYAAEHRLLTLLREFDAGRGWEGLGFPSCACWLNFACGMDRVTARERMRVAHALGRLPKELDSAALIHDVAGVSAETARRIACDTSVLCVTEGENGEPLSVSRKTRTIPPEIRGALQIRDGGRRFPARAHDRCVDGQQVVSWAEGGATSLENLILLCRHHHRLLQEGGFSCEKIAGGAVWYAGDRMDWNLAVSGTSK